MPAKRKENLFTRPVALDELTAGVSNFGARRAACGLVGRFLPLDGDEWTMFDGSSPDICDKCVATDNEDRGLALTWGGDAA